MMMKKYRERIEAGATLDIQHPGRYFHMLKAVSPVNLDFMKNERVSDEARDVTAGIWFEPQNDFDRIRMTNPELYPVTVEFLVSGGRCGWSMPPPSCETYTVGLAGTPASVSVSGDVIDLGDDWGACVLTLQCDLLVAGAGGSMYLNCSQFLHMGSSALGVGQGYNGVAYTVVSGTNHHVSSIRPTGRYVRQGFTNGANPQTGPARMQLHVMRNVTA